MGYRTHSDSINCGSHHLPLLEIKFFSTVPMLRIEKVFLQGFKSFNDATELIFDAEGITAVVGPNGCGKSNVADALSWVIGEQRAKALRGGKMEDVIFQGSRNRKPSGLAEVILTMRVYESFEIRSPEIEILSVIPSANDATGYAEETIVDSQPASDTLAPSSSNSEVLPKPSTKSAPRQFQEGERITVARRLYRTGESEYEMNGRICRLRDIQDLFAGTGLGGAHYAIIEQGRIGQVLSAKPLDRRALIEEAAGISKFKMRQRASELKLEAAKQNLSRVTDIIAEVERQQSALKRQAAKARRYHRLRNEMRELLKAVFVADYQKTLQNVAELDQKKHLIMEEEKISLAQISHTELSRQEILTRLQQAETALFQTRELASQTNLLLEKSRQQEEYLLDQINSLDQRTAQFSTDQISIIEREKLTTQEIARLRADLISIEADINQEAKFLSEAETTYLHLSQADDLREKELEQLLKRLTESATHQEKWKQLVQQFTDAVERSDRSIHGLITEQERASDQLSKCAEELETIEHHIEALESEYQNGLIQLEEAESALAHKEIEVAQLDKLHTDTLKSLTATEQRLKSLRELDEKRAYFSEPVQAIIRASQDSSVPEKFNITSTLADYLKVNSYDEVIIEVGLREELQYLIAPTFDDALNAIAFLKREKLGRATFLVFDSTSLYSNGSHDTGNHNGNGLRLIDLLGVKPELQHVIRHALPRISQTLITNEVHQAIADSIKSNGKGGSFLTESGEFISAGHIISGGSTTEQGSGILALKREIESLHITLTSFNEKADEIEHQLNALKAVVKEYAERHTATKEQVREIEKQLALQQGLLQIGQREKERATTHLRVVEKEIAIAQEEKQEAAEKLAHAETELSLAQKQLVTIEQASTEAQEQAVNIRRLATDRTQELSRRRADFAAKSERRKGLQNDIKRLENEAQDIAGRLKRTHAEAFELEVKTQQLRSEQSILAPQIETLQEKRQSQTTEVEKFEAELMEVKNIQLRLETEVNRLRENVSALRENKTEIDIAKATSAAHLEHLASSCYTELGVSLSNILEKPDESEALPPTIKASSLDLDEEDGDQEDLRSGISWQNLTSDFDLETAKIRLQELRNKVEGIGPVNLLAIEEIGEADERLRFLLEQKADIEEAVKDTLAVITELKRRSRDRFVEAFHQINKNFTEMFLELFGGGHGEMRLIDETDVLESGIDLIAQPPGKRLQNVLLLSGGEKAMAALALIMGIFKYRPSPFCLLDEVDAPLDDVNIGRFANKVLEMSKNTQFLVITHSKRTMEAAKTMYGVTMEDPGVSKLISVRLT